MIRNPPPWGRVDFCKAKRRVRGIHTPLIRQKSKIFATFPLGEGMKTPHRFLGAVFLFEKDYFFALSTMPFAKPTRPCISLGMIIFVA